MEDWLQPFLFFGKNRLSLIGGAITSASALTLIAFWAVDILGHGFLNPYVGILIFLVLPALFLFGLLLIPVGIWIRRKELKRAGELPAKYPRIDLADPVFRRAIDFVIVATIVNFL